MRPLDLLITISHILLGPNTYRGPDITSCLTNAKFYRLDKKYQKGIKC